MGINGSNVNAANEKPGSNLEACLLMDYVWILLILLGRYPHLLDSFSVHPHDSVVCQTYLLERVEASQYGTTDPCGILPLRWCINFNFYVFQSKFLHFIQ